MENYRITSYNKEGLKICSDCKMPQSKDSYYKNPKIWDGITNICKSCYCKRDKERRIKYAEKEKIRRHVKYLKYKEREIKYDSIYKANRRETDPKFKMLRNLRDRHRILVVSSSTRPRDKHIQLLGCTTIELKKHFEDKFTKEMSWGNHGIIWQIDHIYPLCLVNWDDNKDISKASHYTNLQPLLIEDNIKKGRKII